jgi:hypothetical protein
MYLITADCLDASEIGVRTPMVYRCSSASTSSMLAVLHVDTFHAPEGIAWIEEQPP